MGSRVVVVGGGLAGLATAHALLVADPELDVLVLDAADRPGGKARRAEVAGIGIDVGAESVLSSSSHARELAASLGLTDRLVHPEPASASIWTRGALHPMPAGTFMGVPGSRAELLGPLSPSEVADASRRDGSEPEERDLSIGEALGRAAGRAVVDRLVEPILGGVYAGRVDELSMQAAMAPLWPAVAAGRPLAAAVDELLPPPGSAPRSPRLMGIDGGVVTLAERLVEAITTAGGAVRPGAIARELHRTPTGWRVVTGPVPAPLVHEADALVLATPAAASGRMLAPHAPASARALGEIDYASMAVAVLALPRTALTADLPGSGFLVPAIDGRAIKASTFVSRKWAWADRESAAADVVLVRASLGRAGETAALQREDTELVRDAHAEIGLALGRPLPAPVDAYVQRWGGGLPQYTVGHRDRVERIRAGVAQLPGVEVAGAAYDGVGIAAVLATAHDAARATMSHLAQTDRSTDPARPTQTTEEIR